MKRLRTSTLHVFERIFRIHDIDGIVSLRRSDAFGGSRQLIFLADGLALLDDDFRQADRSVLSLRGREKTGGKT
jgi:hypothetical protein